MKCQIPVWLRIWKFLDDNSKVTVYGSVVEIINATRISVVAVHKNIIFLDEIGIIDLVKESRNKKVILTQKFFTTRDLFSDIYDAMEGL